MFWLWLIFSLLFVLFAECLLALQGLAPPLLLYGVFYFSCFVPWQKGLPLYLLLAAFSDAWYGRILPVNGLAVLALLLLSGVWRRHGDSNNAFALLLPGFFIALINLLLLQLMSLISAGFRGLPGLLFSLSYLLVSLPLLPLMHWLCERIARRLALPRLETNASLSAWKNYDLGERDE